MNAAAVMSGIWMDFVKGSINAIITEGALMMAAEPWYRWNAKMAGIEMDDKKDGRKRDGDRDGDHDGMHEEEMMTKMIKFVSF